MFHGNDLFLFFIYLFFCIWPLWISLSLCYSSCYTKPCDFGICNVFNILRPLSSRVKGRENGLCPFLCYTICPVEMTSMQNWNSDFCNLMTKLPFLPCTFTCPCITLSIRTRSLCKHDVPCDLEQAKVKIPATPDPAPYFLYNKNKCRQWGAKVTKLFWSLQVTILL